MQPTEIVFDPHVAWAVGSLVLALVGVVLALVIDAAFAKPRR